MNNVSVLYYKFLFFIVNIWLLLNNFTSTITWAVKIPFIIHFNSLNLRL